MFAGPVVEFNIQTDPEAAKVMFESGVRLVMVPLEVRSLGMFNKHAQNARLPPEQAIAVKYQQWVAASPTVAYAFSSSARPLSPCAPCR